MDHFAYYDGELYAEKVPVSRIASEIGTPFFCYSTATLRHHYRVFTEAFSGVDAAFCYAVKANANLAVIRTLAELGAGADVVSAGELERALAAEIAPAQIVFSGVGKTPSELNYAIRKNILLINTESNSEINKEKTWILETDGVNLLNVFNSLYVDFIHTYSNDLIEV